MSLFPLKKVLEVIGVAMFEKVDAVVGWELPKDHEGLGEDSIRGDGDLSNAVTDGRISGALGMVMQGAVAGGRGRSWLICELLSTGAV